MFFFNSFYMGLASVEREATHAPAKNTPGRRWAISQGYCLWISCLGQHRHGCALMILQLHIADGNDPFAVELDVSMQGQKDR